MIVISDDKKALEAAFHIEYREREREATLVSWFKNHKKWEIKSQLVKNATQKKILGGFKWVKAKTNESMNKSKKMMNWVWIFLTAESGDDEVDQRIYRRFVGPLLCLAKQTRPDIIFRVNILSAHINAPNNQHWLCEKRFLQYLQGSKILKITYKKEASYHLVVEGDTDLSADANDRILTTG